jgi:peptide/nickel transport system substrate-binding protein
MMINRRFFLAATSRPTLSAALAMSPQWGFSKTPNDTLKVVSPWEIGGLQPARSGYIFQRLGIVETLLSCNADGTPEPGLAVSWGLSADGLRWRFDIRPNVQFHDLTRLTAANVVISLEQARKAPAVLSLAPIASIEAESERSILIVLRQRFATLPALLAHYSTAILAANSWEANGSVNQVIGTGYYKVKQLAPPQSLQAERFAQHWSKTSTSNSIASSAANHVHYLAAGRAETRFALAQSNQADLVYGLDPASLERLRTSKNVAVQSMTVPRTIILKVNAGLSALAPIKARRAISLAINRQAIAKSLLRDPELAATQLFSPALGRWHDPSLPPLAYDPQQASELLASLGWQKKGDYLLNSNNESFSLSLTTFPDRPELPIIATALQAQLKLIGVRLDIKIGNSGDIPLLHKNGTLQTGLAARNYGFVADPLGTIIQDFSAVGGDWGAMAWSNPRLNLLLTTLAQGGELRNRQFELIREANKILNDELPVIPIAWYRQQVAVNRRLRNVQIDPLDRDYWLQKISMSS